MSQSTIFCQFHRDVLQNNSQNSSQICSDIHERPSANSGFNEDNRVFWDVRPLSTHHGSLAILFQPPVFSILWWTKTSPNLANRSPALHSAQITCRPDTTCLSSYRTPLSRSELQRADWPSIQACLEARLRRNSAIANEISAPKSNVLLESSALYFRNGTEIFT
jgi:hypothetical protein